MLEWKHFVCQDINRKLLQKVYVHFVHVCVCVDSTPAGLDMRYSFIVCSTRRFVELFTRTCQKAVLEYNYLVHSLTYAVQYRMVQLLDRGLHGPSTDILWIYGTKRTKNEVTNIAEFFGVFTAVFDKLLVYFWGSVHVVIKCWDVSKQRTISIFRIG
jgi:hypothetical protein